MWNRGYRLKTKSFMFKYQVFKSWVLSLIWLSTMTQLEIKCLLKPTLTIKHNFLLPTKLQWKKSYKAKKFTHVTLLRLPRVSVLFEWPLNVWGAIFSVYLETGRLTNAATLTMTLGTLAAGATATRTWKVRILLS